jgi:CHASE3 domain sensor protein
MNLQAKKIGLAFLAMALAILLAVSSLAYQEWRQFGEASFAANQSQRALAVSHNLLGQLRDAEAAQRAFLLTGRDERLEAYNAALSQIPAGMNELTQLTAGRSAQFGRLQRLQELVSAKMEEMRGSIELRRNGGPAADATAPGSGEKDPTMDRIRRISQEFEREENGRWTTAWAQLQSSARSARIIAAMGGVLVALLVGGGIIALLRVARENKA